MIHLKTTRPCVASGHPSYRWDTTDDVVPVDDVTAGELLALHGAGFYEVPAPIAAGSGDETDDPADDGAGGEAEDSVAVTGDEGAPGDAAQTDPADATATKPARVRKTPPVE